MVVRDKKRGEDVGGERSEAKREDGWRALLGLKYPASSATVLTILEPYRYSFTGISGSRVEAALFTITAARVARSLCWMKNYHCHLVAIKDTTQLMCQSSFSKS